MLLDVEKFADQFTRRHVTKRIAGILHSLTRETDIKGWYKYDYVVGVILADTSAAGAERLRSKLRRKLSEALRKEEFYGVGVSIHVFPEDAGEKEQDAEPETAPDMALYPDLTSPGRRRLSLMAKRAIDFVGAIAGLVIFSPLFLLIPALIKLTSKGPVLFRQERMGQFETKFTFLKFRTMYVGNDGGWGSFGADNDRLIFNNIPFADHGALLSGRSGGIATGERRQDPTGFP